MKAMLLAMLLTGCVNTRYIERPYIPPLNFPEFPQLKNYNYIRNPDGTVTIDGEYLIKLTEYGMYMEGTEKTYNDLRKLYNRRIIDE